MTRKSLVFLVPVLLFALVALSFMRGLTRDPGYLPSMLIDQPAPQFDLPPIKDDKPGFSTETLAGDVSLVNVFGSWCIACEVEHPVLMEIEREGLAPIYGIDWKDKPGAGAAWLARRGDPYTAIGDDAAGRAAIEFGVTGAPETFVIDRAGRVRHKHTGPITREDWESVLKPMIEDLKNDPDRP